MEILNFATTPRSALLMVCPAPRMVADKGTGVSAAGRYRTAVAPMAAHLTKTTQTSALLPTSDVVTFGDVAGIRSWSPPV